MTAVIECSDVVFASYDDEVALHDDVSPQHTVHRIGASGVREVLVKDGAAGAWLATDDTASPIVAASRNDAIDTTSAGHAFAAGYLAAMQPA